MGLFSAVKGAASTVIDAMNENAQQQRLRKAEAARERQEQLLNYRERGIYVLAVYVGGSLWNYFHYPSENHRQEAARKFWPPFFREQGVSYHCENVDPE